MEKTRLQILEAQREASVEFRQALEEQVEATEKRVHQLDALIQEEIEREQRERVGQASDPTDDL